MKARGIHILMVIAVILICSVVSAQDVHFSGNDLTPLHINPGLTGLKDLSFSVAHRNQWKKIGDPFRTYYASAQMPIELKRKSKPGGLGVGIDFYNDRAGKPQVTNTQVNLHLAYHLYLSDKTSMSVGIYGGYKQINVRPGGGKWGSQHNGYFYDNSLPSGESWIDGSANAIDVGTGFVFTHRREKTIRTDQRSNTLLRAGVAFYHVNQPNLSMLNDEGYRLPMRLTALGTANLKLGKKFLLSPQIIVQAQSPFYHTLIGTNLRYVINEKLKNTSMVSQVLGSYVSLGVYYRSNDAVVLRTRLDYSNYSVGLCYDITVSRLNSSVQSRGAIEVSLRYKIPQSNNRALY